MIDIFDVWIPAANIGLCNFNDGVLGIFGYVVLSGCECVDVRFEADERWQVHHVSIGSSPAMAVRDCEEMRCRAKTCLFGYCLLPPDSCALRIIMVFAESVGSASVSEGATIHVQQDQKANKNAMGIMTACLQPLADVSSEYAGTLLAPAACFRDLCFTELMSGKDRGIAEQTYY